jgi:hypothetical protein
MHVRSYTMFLHFGYTPLSCSEVDHKNNFIGIKAQEIAMTSILVVDCLIDF